MDGLEERIRGRAYQMWENEGRPDGQAETHWEKARILVAIEDDRPSCPQQGRVHLVKRVAWLVMYLSIIGGVDPELQCGNAFEQKWTLV